MAYWHRARGAICSKPNLSYKSWFVLSLESCLLTFHCKVKEFFLATCPFDKY